MAISDIKKTYKYSYKGFVIKIDRNFRNDNFLKEIVRTENGFREKIFPPRDFFFTIKGAKEYAIKLIDL